MQIKLMLILDTIPASEKSLAMFLFGLESGTSSTQLYTSSSCYSVSYMSILSNSVIFFIFK